MAKLIKKFGKHEAGEDLPVNDTLRKHLLSGGFIAADQETDQNPKPRRRKK